MSVTEEITFSKSSKYCLFFFSYCEILRITNLILAALYLSLYILLPFKYNCFIKWKSFGNLKSFH